MRAQLTAKNLTRQEEQAQTRHRLQRRDLDQARSDDTQAAAEYAADPGAPTEETLSSVPVEKKHTTLLAVESPVSGSVTALAIARGNMINDPTQPIR